MIRAPLFTALLLASSSALALQEPPPGKDDPRVRTIAYNPNNVTDVAATVGDVLAITFPDAERVEPIAVSDSKFLQATTAGDNFAFLKPMKEMPKQPIFIKTIRRDGSKKLYVLQLHAASADNPVYLIRFSDPKNDNVKVAAATPRKKVKQKPEPPPVREDDAERALSKARPAAPPNRDYDVNRKAQPSEVAPPPPPVAPAPVPQVAPAPPPPQERSAAIEAPGYPAMIRMPDGSGSGKRAVLISARGYALSMDTRRSLFFNRHLKAFKARKWPFGMPETPEARAMLLDYANNLVGVMPR